ncbi:putative E3 ubiquitin-protein ligase HERC3 isoform X2 [Brachyhypopomus gauderio]|uniref:putative E3 ubiquitin-protein ligase HERC3 isoform X2 n=1 Tax=Brachyhypopomus gauderio TaxID=698409 RepID=UPI0040410446
MFYWDGLTSVEYDSLNQDLGNVFKQIFATLKITNFSVRDDELIAFLGEDGKVTVFIPNGQSDKRPKQGDTRSPHKRLHLDLKKERAKFVSSGKKHVVLVSEAGTVKQWNCSDHTNIPRTFSNVTNRQIAQVACGNDHSLILTKDGQLFTWGQNSSGQLGVGKGEPNSLSPQPLKSLCGIPLAQISAGGDHSFALSLSGAVFGWGRNNAGQLGLGDRQDRYHPECVKGLNHKMMVLISCGEDHTAVLAKGGLMFTFGSGCYGQLGHNSFRDELRPRLLAGLWGSKVLQIACGRHHTLALVGSKTIYSFGCGEQGQLGNGERTNQCVPLPVHLPPDCDPNQTIAKIIAGGNISVGCCNKQNEKLHMDTSKPNLCRGTSVLDDEIIDRWILQCDSKDWRKAKREIKRMFSSVSCINGSFSDKSDKHYKTSSEHSGLDLTLARLAFEKMSKKDKVLSEVQKVVEKSLLPSLGSTTAGVEALRIYLILPELLRVLNKRQQGTRLALELARAILNLDQESSHVLMRLWTRLPYYYYRTLVKTFHFVSVNFISQLTTKICDYWKELSSILGVLQKLYTVNNQRVTGIVDSSFYIREVKVFLDSVSLGVIFEDKQKILIFANFMKNIDVLSCHPFILDMRWFTSFTSSNTIIVQPCL